MALHPKVSMDLALAPVAAAIDMNLQRLRDKSPKDLEADIELQLNRRRGGSPEERAAEVRDLAIRDVDLHGWDVAISDDHVRLQMSGGSVGIELRLSVTLLAYIENGLD